MRNLRKLAALFMTLIMITGALVACGSKTEDTKGTPDKTDGTKVTTTTAPEGGAKLSGHITLAGSTSMEKLANAAAEAFMAKYPDVQVSAEFTGSSAGIEALLNKTVDIGDSSRSLKDEEKSKGAVENIVAIDGIAVITDKANKVANLTKDQLAKVYKGEITNWKDLGGADQPIVVIGREAGSGTRDAFEELLEIKDACKYSNEINSTGGVYSKVLQTPGSIGYVSLDVLDDTVNAVSLNDVKPTEENIKAGTYLLSRPFVMATNGEISAQNDLVKAFFEYMKSDEGKELVKTVGLITVD